MVDGNLPSYDADRRCAFCRIVRGDDACYRVFEDNVSLAFLDRRPLFHGHCLLIPKEHYETLVDVPPRLVTPLFINVQLLAQSVVEGLQAEGTLIAINNRVSQSVPHLHVHVVPRRKKDGLRGFFWPRHPYKDKAAVLKIQRVLQSTITQLQSSKAVLSTSGGETLR